MRTLEACENVYTCSERPKESSWEHDFLSPAKTIRLAAPLDCICLTDYLCSSSKPLGIADDFQFGHAGDPSRNDGLKEAASLALSFAFPTRSTGSSHIA